MRVALNFYRVDPSRGGAETYVRDLCHSLVRAGHAVDLYAHEWNASALPLEVRCVRVPAHGPTRAGRIWSFAEHSEAILTQAADAYDCTIGFINTWHHDVLIPQGGVRRASVDYNAMRFGAGLPRMLYRLSKQLAPHKTGILRAIERKQYDPKRKTRVVAVSRMVAGHLVRYEGVARERIGVIPNAIDAGRLYVADTSGVRERVRKHLGLGESDLLALFAGHNFWLKGLKPLLQALRLRQERAPNARPIHLLVCGGGRLAPFRRLVKRLELDQTVHLVGFLPEVADGFWASDFFVLPTYYDPCSLVVFEALACGLPVITTACNGAGELITEGREGFVIESPDTIEALADRLDRITDDDIRRAMSANAKRLGQAQSFDQHVARLLELCTEVAYAKAIATPHVIGSAATRRQLAE